MTTSRLKIDKIRTDGGTQTRAAICNETVAVYADAIENGDAFPPIDVFYDGRAYWCADGFHRIAANKVIGYAEIDCTVHQGTQRDAVLHSVGANREHGLRRTNADKRRAVTTLLNDKEWAGWSDREIARRCGVSADLVAALRPKVTVDSDSEPKTYTTKHGTQATMNTANIGRTPQSSPPEPPRKPLACQPNMPVTSGNDAEPASARRPSAPPVPEESYSSGMSYATMAISQLERIHAKDIYRREAFDKVARWIQEHR